LDSFLAVTSVYIFIFLGYIARKNFGDKLDEKSFVLLSIYILQPILTFWGLTRVPIDLTLLYVPFLYLVIIFFSMILLIIFSKYLFKPIEKKEKNIFIATSLMGNTGNLGIPLGIAMFGEMSVAYTSIVNITNMFFIYSVGIYLFAHNIFNLKRALTEILKIPVLWFAILALAFNYTDIEINTHLDRVLQMGAYASIVIQLIIFGIYLGKTEIQNIDYKLSILTSFAKLIFVPIVGLLVIALSDLSDELGAILMISLIVPLAINNINMAELYNSKPIKVTATVLISTILFLLIAYFDVQIIRSYFAV
jgi:predicted permease